MICAMVLAAGCQFDRPTDVPPVDAGVFPPTSWARTFASSGTDGANGLVVDADGNVYATGTFESNAMLAGSPFASAGLSDVFVASFDPRGETRWIRRFGGVGSDAGKAIVLMADGRVAVAGDFDGAVDFGAGIEPGTGAGAFVMVLSRDGVFDWVSTIRGPGVWAIATAASGRVLVEMVFSGTITLPDGAMVSSAGSADTLVVSYSAAGQRSWFRRLGGAGLDVPGGIAAVGEDAYLGLTSAGPADFGGGVMAPIGSADMVVARLAGDDGRHLWSRRYGSTGSTTPWNVAATPSGVAVVGCFGQTLQVGATSAQAIGGQDSFIAMLDASGAPVWLTSVAATAFDCAIAVAPVDGGIAVGGNFVGDLVLDGVPNPSAGAEDLWLAEFSETGVLRSRRRSGGVGTDSVTSIARASGFITLAGAFGGDSSILGHPLQGVGTDGFLLQAPE